MAGHESQQKGTGQSTSELMGRAFSPYFSCCVRTWGVAPGWYSSGLWPSFVLVNTTAESLLGMTDRKAKATTGWQLWFPPFTKNVKDGAPGFGPLSVLGNATTDSLSGMTNKKATATATAEVNAIVTDWYCLRLCWFGGRNRGRVRITLAGRWRG